MLTVMTNSLHTIKLKLNECSVPRSELVQWASPYIFPIQNGGTYTEVCGNIQKLIAMWCHMYALCIDTPIGSSPDLIWSVYYFQYNSSFPVLDRDWGVARTLLMLYRTQHGHTTFVRNSAQIAEVFSRSGTCSVSVRGERLRLEFCGYT